MSHPGSGGPLFIHAGLVVTMDAKLRILRNQMITVDPQLGIVTEIAPYVAGDLPPHSTFLDATRELVMPGLINGHSHAGMAFFRGFAEELPLHRWLGERIFPVETKWVSPELVYWGTRLACLEMIRSGTTTFNDMYYFQAEVARAAHDSGMRCVCGPTLLEKNNLEGKNWKDVVDDYLAVVSDYPLVTPSLAPHAVYSIGEKKLREVIARAEKDQLTLHMHVAETEKEQLDCLKKKSATPVQYLDRLGMWEQRVILAHGIWLPPEDLKLLATKSRVGIVYNPESNMKLGSGTCPVSKIRAAGIPMGIGTDSAASNNNLDLFQEADIGSKLQNLHLGPGVVKAEHMVRLLTSEGATVLGLGDKIGSIAVGKAADLIAVDLTVPHAIPFYSPYTHIIYGASGADVRHSIIGGQVVMKDRQILNFDESEVLNVAREWAERIFQWDNHRPEDFRPTSSL